MDTRQALLGGVAAIALGAGLLTFDEVAQAQQLPGTIVSQSSYKADVATLVQAAPSTITGCTTVGTTVANSTVTVPAVAGSYFYLTSLYIGVIEGDTTGTASTVAWSTTNLPGSPIWITRDDVNATVSPAQHQFQVSEQWPTGLRASAAGTAVTLVPSATSAHQAFCPHLSGYYSPQ